MSEPSLPIRISRFRGATAMDRRSSLQWLLAAAGGATALAQAADAPATGKAQAGIGTDPDLQRRYRSGELWPLSFTARESRCATALCALIIPADAESPSAAELQVQVFIDEWISAPYPDQQKDRALIVGGLAWLDGESERRFGQVFAAASAAQQAELGDALCRALPAGAPLAEAARFFARFRDLCAGGFYTTPEGMRDLGFVGNTPTERFDGPPEAVLRQVGVL